MPLLKRLVLITVFTTGSFSYSQSLTNLQSDIRNKAGVFVDSCLNTMITQPLFDQHDILFLPFDSKIPLIDPKNTASGVYTFKYDALNNEMWLGGNINGKTILNVNNRRSDGTFLLEDANGVGLRVRIPFTLAQNINTTVRVGSIGDIEDFSTTAELLGILKYKIDSATQKARYEKISPILYQLSLGANAVSGGLSNIFGGSNPYVSSANDEAFAEYTQALKGLYDFMGLINRFPSIASKGISKVSRKFSKEILAGKIGIPSKWTIIDKFVLPFVESIKEANDNGTYAQKGQVIKAAGYLGPGLPNQNTAKANPSTSDESSSSSLGILSLFNIDFEPVPERFTIRNGWETYYPLGKDNYSNKVFNQRFPNGWSERSAFGNKWNHQAFFVRNKNRNSSQWIGHADFHFHIVDSQGNYVIKNLYTEKNIDIANDNFFTVLTSIFARTRTISTKRLDFFWYFSQNLINSGAELRTEIYANGVLELSHDEPLLIGAPASGGGSTNTDLSITHSASSAVSRGASFNVNGSVNVIPIQNSVANVSNPKVEFFLSADNSVDATDIKIGSFSPGGVYSAGQSFSFSKNFTVSNSWPCGSQNLLVTVNNDQSIQESNFSNNISKNAIFISGCSSGGSTPDLTSVKLEVFGTNLVPGAEVFPYLTLINNSSQSITASFKVDFYITLSSANSYNGSGSRFITSETVTGLSANSTTNAIGVERLPYNRPNDCGAYKVWAVIDRVNSISEANENNNIVSTPIQLVGCGNKPELAFDDKEIRDFAEERGSTLRGEIDIKNFSAFNGITQPIEAAFYLSLDNQLDTNIDRHIKTVVYSSNGLTATGQTGDQHFSIQVPTNWPCGPVNLIIQIDPRDLVNENDESNNQTVLSYTVYGCLGERPDFLPFNLSLSNTNISVGSEIEPTVKVKNASFTAENTFRAPLWYMLSTDKKFDLGKDIFLEYDKISDRFQPQEIDDEQQKMIVKRMGRTGTAYLLAVADPMNQVKEENENNNVAYLRVNVSGSGVNLDVDADSESYFTMPVNLDLGQSIRLSYEIDNNNSVELDDVVYGVYLSKDNKLDIGKDTLISTEVDYSADENDIFRQIDENVKANDDDNVSTVVKIPDEGWCGSAYLIFIADLINAWHENDESNNILVDPVTIMQGARIRSSVDSVALGEPILLTAKGGSSYSWRNLATGDTISFRDSVVVFTDSAVSYAVRIEDQNCVTEDTINLPLRISIDTTITNFPGDSVNIIAEPSGGKKPYQYNWEYLVEDSSKVSIVDSLITGTSGQYRLTVTDANNRKNQLAMRVRCQGLPPNLTNTTISSHDSSCEGDIIDIILTVDTTQSINSYSWQIPVGWNLIRDTVITDSIASAQIQVGGQSDTVKITAQGSCGIATKSAYITATPQLHWQQDSIIGSTAVCFADTVTYYAESNAPDGQYNWIIPAGWNSVKNLANDTIKLVPQPGQGTLQVWVANSCDTTDTLSLAVTGLNPFQPGSLAFPNTKKDSTICFGATPTLKLATAATGGLAAGADSLYSYQWYRDTDSNFGGTTMDTLSNATDTTYTLTGNESADTYWYWLEVSDKDGACDVKVTESVKIDVLKKLTSGSITVANKTLTNNALSICYGEPVTLQLDTNNLPAGGEANGALSSYAYQWEWKQPNAASYSDISGSTANTLIVNNDTLAAGTYEYRLRVIDNCDTATTDSLVITVYDSLQAPVISTSQTKYCANVNPKKLTVGTPPKGGDGQFTYIWQGLFASATSWADLDTANNSASDTNYVFTTNNGIDANTGFTADTKVYYRLKAVSDNCGGSQFTNELFSDTLTISTYSLPTVSAQGVGGTANANQINICYNTRFSSLVTQITGGNSSNYSYKWQTSTDNFNSNQTNLTIDNDTLNGSDLSADLTDTTYYRLIVTDGCGEDDTSAVFTINVYDELQPGAIEASGFSNDSIYLCKGSTATLQADQDSLYSGGEAGADANSTYTFFWQVDTLSRGNATTFKDIANSAANNYQIPSTQDSGRYRYRLGVVDTGCGDTVVTGSIHVEVYPELQRPKINTNSRTICRDTVPSPVTHTQIAMGGNGGFKYQWQRSKGGNINFQDIGSSSSNLSDYTPLSGIGADSAYYYRLRAVSDSCSADTLYSDTLTISTYSLPTVSAQGVGGTANANQINICYNTRFSSLVTQITGGNSSNYSYMWQTSTDNFNSKQTNLTIDNDTLNGSDLSADLTDTTYYRLIVTDGCGEDDTSAVFTISVYDELQPGAIEASGFSNATIYLCKGSTATLQADQDSLYSGGEAGADANSTYTFFWQVDTLSRGNATTFKDIANSAANNYQIPSTQDSGRYRYRLGVVDTGCGDTVFTGSVTATVEPLPSTPNNQIIPLDPDLNSLNSLCKNQQNVLIRLKDHYERKDFIYSWNVSGNKPIVKDHAVFSMIKNTDSLISDSLSLSITNNLSAANPQCSRVYAHTGVKTSEAPDTFNIVAKNNLDNLLIAKNGDTTLWYNWGYWKPGDAALNYVSGWIQQPFYLYNSPQFDTTTKKYFVAIAKDSSAACRTYAFLDDIENFVNLPESATSSEPPLSFTLYPNPNQGRFTIAGPLKKIQDLRVYNILGQRLAVQYQQRTGQVRFQKPPPPGYYLVRLFTERGQVVRKIIIEH